MLQEFDLVITTKLHVGIVSWVLGTPVCSIAAHSKTIRFYRQIRRDQFCVPIASACDNIADWLSSFMRDELKLGEGFEALRQELRSRAQSNLDAVSTLIGRQVAR